EDSEFMELHLDKNYTLKGEMDSLYIKLYSQNRSFDSLFQEAENRMHLIYIFLAILELYKDGLILIEDNIVMKKEKE
ncbi:MAG: segregation/condensation protein A, partial [Fusobacterium sp.]|nr:segregation/condensation protein A [Fusobacterium sp.]